MSKNINTYTNGVKTFFKLYNTTIVIAGPSGVELNSGGYLTATTKKYMNKFTPQHISIYQRNNEWFVDDNKNNKTYNFYDGIVIAY